MKKPLAPVARLLFGIAIPIFLFSSCHKEDLHRKPFEAAIKTFYRVAPIKPTTVTVNGAVYISTAFFPGAGTGKASYLGDCANYFNQQVYGAGADTPPSGSIAAPVSEVPGYLVTGGPLPLIQAGDFTAFANVVTLLRVPAQINGKVVNSVFKNANGDAIYTSAITGSGGTYPLSAILVGFNGKALIIGGSGCFSNATGEIDYEGYFNIADPNDATLNAKGWISY